MKMLNFYDCRKNLNKTVCLSDFKFLFCIFATYITDLNNKGYGTEDFQDISRLV